MKKNLIISLFATILLACGNSGSSNRLCSSNTDVSNPIFHSEILFDDNNNVTDWRRTGELTSNEDFYYNGSVTIYSKSGSSRDFPCYIGNTGGLDQGCRGIIYDGKFYNLDRNNWITIDGIKYKACDN